MPSFVSENKLARQGLKLIAGVDEVGCGPLAGPIVAAAVIFPLNHPLPGIDDSKKLSARQREILFSQIVELAIAVGIGMVSHRQIDAISIWRANILAMEKAVGSLKIKPEFLLIDGARFRLNLPIPQKGVKGGDGKCASIAAASIVAKVTRDRLMIRFHEQYPQYGFARHKGYGTKEHLNALRKFGPCPAHRLTFCP